MDPDAIVRTNEMNICLLNHHRHLLIEKSGPSLDAGLVLAAAAVRHRRARAARPHVRVRALAHPRQLRLRRLDLRRIRADSLERRHLFARSLLALLEECSPDASNHRATYEPGQRPGVRRSGPAATLGEVFLVHRDGFGVQALLRLQSAERMPRRHHPAPAPPPPLRPAGLAHRGDKARRQHQAVVCAPRFVVRKRIVKRHGLDSKHSSMSACCRPSDQRRARGRTSRSPAQAAS